MYTTGEIAKRCGITVRAVQYYDSRNILVPSQLSEGGRRLYSEEDLKKLETICFLRELDISISAISQILEEPHPERVISLILEQQERSLEEEISFSQERLRKVRDLQKGLRDLEQVSLESIADAAHVMENRQNLRRVRGVLLAAAIPFGIMEWTAIFLWILQGVWWPFALYSVLLVPFVVWTLGYYWRKVSYICPGCHQVFKPGKRELFIARHSLTTRKLTCPCCGRKGFCVETYGGENET